MNIDRPKKASFIKKRFIIAVLATLCPVVCYISRQNLALAIVAMVNDDFHSLERPQSLVNQRPAIHNRTDRTFDSSIDDTQRMVNVCPRPITLDEDGHEHTAPIPITYGPKYHWTQDQKNFCLGAFFYTYVIFQIPAARFSEVIGAKWALAAAGIGSSILSLLSPLAASIHVYLFVLIRLMMGVCQTALYPACYVLYTHWLPPTERSLALPILVVGAYIGSIITSIATGQFSEQPAFGWPFGFYMPGIVCAIWSILWLLFAASEPREHKSISLEELEFIELKNGISGGAGGGVAMSTFTQQTKKKSPSWSKIFKSQHIWAMIAAFIASNWSFSITLLLIPSYLNDVLWIPPSSNGFINSIIYTLFCVASPLVGMLATLMIETRPFGITRLNTRKFFQCTAVFSQAIAFILLPLIGCDTSSVQTLLYIQIVLFTFINGGEVHLPSDLSLDFAGTIYAIGNCVGSSTGFVVPMVHALIVENNKDRDQWNTYFYVAATITSAGGLIFFLFGKNDLQDYSRDDVGEFEIQDDMVKSPKEASINLDGRRKSDNNQKQMTI